MYNLLFRNKPLLVSIITATVIAVIAILTGIFVTAPDIINIGQKPSPALSLEVNKYPAVATLSPKEYQLLIPGQLQTFVITFHGNGDVSILRATLSKSLIRNPNSTATVPITTAFDNQKREITVMTKEPVASLSTYTLTIQNPRTTNTLLKINYHSGESSPTPVVSNNPALSQYLPHQTDSYTLTYNKERNIYVFNFKIDPESDSSIASQYDNAVANATQFIESKGIPINTITIEWKRH